MTFLWIALGLLVLAGALLVLRTLHRVAVAALQLQRTVDALKTKVDGQLQELNIDVKALGETVEETRRQ